MDAPEPGGQNPAKEARMLQIYGVYGEYPESPGKVFFFGAYEAETEEDAKSKAQLDVVCNGDYSAIMIKAVVMSNRLFSIGGNNDK